MIFWFIVGTIFAFYVPDLYLSRLIRQRRERVRLGLPDALDLLAICMEAGLGLDQALMRVGGELNDTHPDLSDEFNLISLEQRAGTPRIDAWRHMAERTKLEIVSSFVSMLVQTDKFGTPISKALAVFSDSLRTQRRQKAEELAAKTTIKMVFPTCFLYLSQYVHCLTRSSVSQHHSQLADAVLTQPLNCLIYLAIGESMDTPTIIRVVAGVLFVVVLLVLIQRRKRKV